MMADPMANLTGDPVGGQSQDNLSNQKEIFDPMVLQVNLQRIDRIHSVMGIASGCIAGILGLTGLEGFGCFLLLHVFVSLAIWVVKMKCSLAAYSKQSWTGYMTSSLQSTGLSFTLFWTLFYGLVYLY